MPSGPTTTAAAAWSWVEKMLQDAQRTSAPSATSVSISTAVCTVMCSEPVIRAPASGCGVGELPPGRHQPRHLVLGQPDLVAAELRESEVRDLEIGRAAIVLMVVSTVVIVLVMLLKVVVHAAASSRSCFSCSNRSQSSALDVIGPARLRLEPALDGVAQLRARRDPSGERHVRKRDVEPRQQLLERAQPLELGRAVQPVAGGRASR